MLEAEFGKELPLTKTRGKVHEWYLGMTIDFSEDGKVCFTMIDYIDNIHLRGGILILTLFTN